MHSVQMLLLLLLHMKRKLTNEVVSYLFNLCWPNGMKLSGTYRFVHVFHYRNGIVVVRQASLAFDKLSMAQPDCTAHSPIQSKCRIASHRIYHHQRHQSMSNGEFNLWKNNFAVCFQLIEILISDGKAINGRLPNLIPHLLFEWYKWRTSRHLVFSN